MITVKIDASEAAALVEKAVCDVSGCSGVTAALIGQLLARDSHGREKYGTTLDRTDLSLVDWLQHQAEELMDGAGYALAAKREAERLQAVERAARAVMVAAAGADTIKALEELEAALHHTTDQEPPE